MAHVQFHDCKQNFLNYEFKSLPNNLGRHVSRTAPRRYAPSEFCNRHVAAGHDLRMFENLRKMPKKKDLDDIDC